MILMTFTIRRVIRRHCMNTDIPHDHHQQQQQTISSSKDILFFIKEEKCSGIFIIVTVVLFGFVYHANNALTYSASVCIASINGKD